MTRHSILTTLNDPLRWLIVNSDDKKYLPFLKGSKKYNQNLWVGRVTFRQQRNERVKWSTVVRPAVQAQHTFSVIRTPDLTPDLPPGHRYTQLWNWTQHIVIILVCLYLRKTRELLFYFYFSNWTLVVFLSFGFGSSWILHQVYSVQLHWWLKVDKLRRLWRITCAKKDIDNKITLFRVA